MTNHIPLLVAISGAFSIWLIGNAVRERVVQDELPAPVNGIRATVQRGLAGPITRALPRLAPSPTRRHRSAHKLNAASAFGHDVLSIYIFLPITITYRNLPDDQGARCKQPAAGQLTVS
jgi:hypothetical protein